MRATDDCKPVDDNKKILITSSGGGVVLVDREWVPDIHVYKVRIIPE